MNGKRTSLTEMERCVAQVLSRDCVCARLDDGRVVAFVVVVDEELVKQGPEAESFLTRCIKNLPSHLVPSKFVQVSEFPMTANGKIDRNLILSKNLESLNRQKISVSEEIRPREIFFELWLKYLRTPPKGSDVFVDVGGDSHLAILLASELEDTTGSYSF